MERETTPNIAESLLSVISALKTELGVGVESVISDIQGLSKDLQSTVGDFLSIGTSDTVEAK